MKPYQIKIETDGGPWVSHDYPCPVYHNLNAVYVMNNGTFQPSWAAQNEGYILVRANNLFKKILVKLFLSDLSLGK